MQIFTLHKTALSLNTRYGQREYR